MQDAPHQLVQSSLHLDSCESVEMQLMRHDLVRVILHAAAGRMPSQDPRRRLLGWLLAAPYSVQVPVKLSGGHLRDG